MIGAGAMILAAGAEMQLGVALDLLLILGCAGLVGVVFARLRLAPIPGYLVAGLLLGIFIEPSEAIDAVTQLATVLLLFTIGMHLDLATLRYGGLSMIVAGLVSTVLSVATMTPLAMIFGLGAPEAIMIAMAFSLSSTAVVMRLLQQRRELRQPSGRMALGVLLIQDVLVIGMLALVPTLAAWGGAGEAGEEGASETGASFLLLLGRVGVLAALIFGSVMLLPRLTAMAARVSSEVLLVLSAAAGLSAAVVTGALGMSPELGAFAAGLVLAGTPVRFQIAGQLAPLRDLFMAVFFTAIGISADVGLIGQQWWVVIPGVGVLLALKTLTIGLGAWVAGSPPATAGRVGVALSQAGEFSIIVLVAGVGAGLVTDRQEAGLLGIVIVSLIVTPALISISTSFGGLLHGLPTAPWWQVRSGKKGASPEASDEDEHAQHVVIAGFGPVGRAVAEWLESADVPYVIVELNPQTVRTQRQLGRRAVYGDATNPEVLESVEVGEASAVVVTIPDDEAMLRACRTIRRMAPETCLVTRAGASSAANLARLLGADQVIVDELASAQAMSQRVVREFANRGLHPMPVRQPETRG